eukprot:g80.t1
MGGVGGLGRQETSIGSHRSSPVPRGPSTPTSTSPILASIPKGSGQSVLADRYTIGDELGRGAHGRVFKAFDKEDNKFVAVKQIPLLGVSKEQLNGVVGEINLLKNLDHTNIVQYFDSVKTNNHLYIILEYMETGSLAGLIKPPNCGIITEQLAAVIVAQILQGLKYLHAQGVVHRDIKGANILTTKDLVIKLADFGVAAKLFDAGSSGNKQDYYNTIAGSPYWMAPEIINLESVTTAADIWSIGCLIIELLTGSPPYFDCQPYQALYRIVQDQHPPLPDVSTETLKSFLLCCFKKEPALRPTAEDLLKHEWITERLERSTSSPIEGANNGGSQEATGTSKNITAVLERIVKHGNQSKMKRRPHPPGSDKVPSSEITESPVGRGSPSNPETDTRGAAGQTPVRAPVDKRRYDASPVPQLTPLTSEKPPSRTNSVSYSDASGLVQARRKDWRDDTISHEKDATSTQMASGTSSPDVRIAPSLPREETELSVIFSDKISEFGSALNPGAGGNESWTGHGFEIMSPNSTTGSSDSRLGGGGGQRGREHYNPSDIERVLRSLHPDQKLTNIKLALRDLVNLVKDDTEAKNYFIKEDALLTLLELLLLTPDLLVIEQTLVLTNMICGDNVLLLRDASTIGLAAEVLKYAEPTFPLMIRTEAAKFMQSLCFTSIKSMDHLIKAQGLKWLIVLLEDGERKKFELKEITVQCLLHIIEAQGTGMELRILRMLCMADLPRKLISALASIHRTYEELSNPRYLSTEGGAGGQDSLVRKSPSSPHSLSDTCIPCTPSDISSSPCPQILSSDESQIDDNRDHDHNGVVMSYEMNQSPVQTLSEKMIDLLFKICTSQAEVHRHMCIPGVLEQFHELLDLPTMDLVHRVVICLRYLSMQPTVVENLQEAGTVCRLIPLLGRYEQNELSTKIQCESLIVIDNICKCAPQWRDKAVQNGIVPYLCTLSRLPLDESGGSQLDRPGTKDDGEMDLRRFSVPLLCRLLCVSSIDTRNVFRENEVVQLFLELLHEERWHKVVLKALAIWLEEDIHYIEAKLLNSGTVQRLISILRSYRYRLASEISAVLNPIHRMLLKSDKLSRKTGLSGLAQVVLEMLDDVDAQTCLTLLRTLTRLYGMHPKPKEFLKRYSVEQYLDHLSSLQNGEGSDRVLIQKEISDLMGAFQMNQIW